MVRLGTTKNHFVDISKALNFAMNDIYIDCELLRTTGRIHRSHSHKWKFQEFHDELEYIKKINQFNQSDNS